MPTGEASRRASYGSMSPMIGARGARTRQSIVDAAMRLFEERGFHSTSVDDIASAVGLSRAALYQYFASKDDLFVELLHESGAALLRVIRRLGPLGPTAEGFANLHWWLGEWAWVYDKYSTMFVQWANVETPVAPVRPLIGQFLDAYTTRMAERFVASGLEGIDPEAAAMTLVAVINRTNYYRYTTTARGLSDDQLLDTLADVAQLTLFPATPPEVFSDPRVGIDGPDPLEPPPRRRVRSELPVRGPLPDRQPLAERFAGSSLRVRGTVRSLLDAGSRVFARHGFHVATVDDIVTEAGFARGTFYKYFTEKTDLLLTLADECADQLPAMMADFEAIASPDGDESALRSWLVDYINFHRRYAGVFRVLLDQPAAEPEVVAAGGRIGETVLTSFDSVLSRTERAHPFCIPAASLVLMALLERIPDQMLSTGVEPEALADLLVIVIRRGFLGGQIRPVFPAAAESASLASPEAPIKSAVTSAPPARRRRLVGRRERRR